MLFYTKYYYTCEKGKECLQRHSFFASKYKRRVCLIMIEDVRFEDFIGIFDTKYNTQPVIDYWEYQKKCGATFNRKGIFGKERRANQRKDASRPT